MTTEPTNLERVEGIRKALESPKETRAYWSDIEFLLAAYDTVQERLAEIEEHDPIFVDVVREKNKLAAELAAAQEQLDYLAGTVEVLAAENERLKARIAELEEIQRVDEEQIRHMASKGRGRSGGE